MTTIILVRHGATAWSGARYLGRGELPLSEGGAEAVRTMAERMAPTLPDGVRIVTSPSIRARTTAEIIAAAMERETPIAIEIDPRWAEVDVGDAEGLTFGDVERRFPVLARQLAAAETEIDWPGGETAGAFHARIEAAWTDLLAAGRPTVVVSHAGAIRLAIGLATGRPAAEIVFPEPGEAIALEVGR